MTIRMDAKIWNFLSRFFDTGSESFRQIDEIHEAELTQSNLIEFELHFTELVELMERAQHYGPAVGAAAKYLSIKQNLSASYQDLRPFLIAYIRFDVEDERVGLRTLGKGTDAFEAIWIAENLQSFINSEDVFFRDRVARAYDAIRDYTEHLYCLLETRE